MNDAFPKHKIYAKQGVGRDLIGPELGKELAAKQFTINHYAEKVGAPSLINPSLLLAHLYKPIIMANPS
eukprot:1848154-Prymnesium_polylepis.1